MSKEKFKVSSRTAVLIGRENVSNENGALIELIKNAYDADSDYCFIIFDIRYQNVPEFFTQDKLEKLPSSIKRVIDKIYIKNNNSYELMTENEWDIKYNNKNYDVYLNKLQTLLLNENSIYIVDNGDGMSYKDVINKWLVIGTENKLENYISTKKRIKAGSKGIGRFALDRLGSQCDIITLSKEEKKVFGWNINWSDYEKRDSTLDDIVVNVNEMKLKNTQITIQRIIRSVDSIYKGKQNKKLDIDYNKIKYGTFIKISNLRDFWDKQRFLKTVNSIDSLLPPNSNEHFKLFLLGNQEEYSYGDIDTLEYTNYDYLLKVQYENGIFNLVLDRKEFEIKRIPKDLMVELSDEGIDIREDVITYSKTFNEVFNISGSSNIEKKQVDAFHNKISMFKMTFYFMKRSLSKPEKNKYYQKSFRSEERRKILNSYGGIKLYRDNFVVRPYGDPNSDSFDWLEFGKRATLSPAAPSHKSGKWCVRSNQVLGAVTITRKDTKFLEDKAGREGIQETGPDFAYFKEIVTNLISEFEIDRQKIMRIMRRYYDRTNESEIVKKSAKRNFLELTEKIARDEVFNEEDKEKLKNAQKAFNYQREEINELKDELKIIKGLASIGLVLTSFTHDFQKIKGSLISDFDYINEKYIEHLNKNNIKYNKNQMTRLINSYRGNIDTLNRWLSISLEIVKPDKRKYKNIDLFKFINQFVEDWKPFLDTYKTKIYLENFSSKKLKYRISNIELISVFSNLIINSLDAFRLKRASDSREIYISISDVGEFHQIYYRDSGPGLDANIKNPDSILEERFSTKYENGEKVGTGLGLWIIDTIINDYGGEIVIPKTTKGFEIKIRLKRRYNSKIEVNYEK